MKNFLPILAIIFLTIFLMPNANASLCKKQWQQSIKMDDDWYKKEQLRLANEDILLKQHANYISKQNKPLTARYYYCEPGDGEECDPLENCQMEKDVKNFHEVEYSIETDLGIVIQKSYCSVIGKCIGYNDFLHTLGSTDEEDRLIDIKGNNAVFYHYFYSAQSNSYEPLFNITNFYKGYELYLDDKPHFSPDDKKMVEIRSIPKKDSSGNFPTGYNINIYEANNFGEYINVEPEVIDPKNPSKIISTFLSRHPECGATPHFNSWKNNNEVILSSLPTSEANNGKKVILYYESKSKKWSCKDDVTPKPKCNSYLPTSTKYSSNLAIEQINDCE